MPTLIRHRGYWWGYVTEGGLHARLCKLGTSCYGFFYAEYEDDPYRKETSVFTAPTAEESLDKARISGRDLFSCRTMSRLNKWQCGEMSVEEDKIVPKRPTRNFKEVTVMKVEKRIFIDGGDGEELTDSQIFTKIAQAEAEIAKLQAIGSKPKKLEARIEEIKGYINDLVDYVDNR